MGRLRLYRIRGLGRQSVEITLTTRKTFIVLAGIPYSGKTTFRKAYLKDFATISLDDLVNEVANASNKTYNEVWHSCVTECNAKLQALYNKYSDQHVVVDMTNLTAKKRRNLIKDRAGDRYKVCIYFPIPEPEEFANRVLNRPFQVISPNILKNMVDMYVEPTKEEGFDAVYTPEQFVAEIKKAEIKA